MTWMMRSLNDNCGAFPGRHVRKSARRERTGIASPRVNTTRCMVSTSKSRTPMSTRFRRLSPPATLKNAERYITPELKAFEDKALSAQERSLARESCSTRAPRRAAAGRPTLGKPSPAPLPTRPAGRFRRVGLEAQLVQTDFAKKSRLTVEGGRHPVVENELAAARNVHRQRLPAGDGRRLLLITGPNMGGKSTTCARWADRADGPHRQFRAWRIAPARPRSTRFSPASGADDLASGRSTFMVDDRIGGDPAPRHEPAWC